MMKNQKCENYKLLIFHQANQRMTDSIMKHFKESQTYSNIQQYGGKLHLIREARIDDGLLDVFVFKGLGLRYATRHLVRMLSRRYLDDPRIVHRQARHIQVETEPVTAVQVDGDPIGTTPVDVSVVPKGLRVLVPPSAPQALFSSTSSAA